MRTDTRAFLEQMFDERACERLVAAGPDYYNEHGYYLPMVAALLNETRAEINRLREEVRLREESQIPMIPRAAKEQMDRLRAALEELLDVAERIRGGDPNLDPERWYAARDYARVVLKATLWPGTGRGGAMSKALAQKAILSDKAARLATLTREKVATAMEAAPGTDREALLVDALGTAVEAMDALTEVWMGLVADAGPGGDGDGD